jgi:uncharacterized DUF497 family protein
MARSDVWGTGFGLVPIWRVVQTRSVPRNREQHRQTLPLDLSEADAPRLTRTQSGWEPILNVYTLRYNIGRWPAESNSIGMTRTRSTSTPTVAPAEFEQLLNNDPLDLNFELTDNEERCRFVGLTNGGRLLSVAWTIRNGKVRAITAFPASVSDRKAFLERPK